MSEKKSAAEVVKFTASRTLSDAEKIADGSTYEIAEGRAPHLVFTAKQLEEAREEMADYFEAVRTVRETIIRTLGNFAAEFSEQDVDRLEEKVKGVENVEDHRSLAYVVAKNWAISFHRKRQRQEDLRKAKSAEQADIMLKKEIDKNEKDEFFNAKSEFWSVAEAVIDKSEALKKGKGRLMMEMFFAYFFEGVSDGLKGEDEMSKKYPGIKRDLRDQYRHRAKVYISNSSQASPLLKKVIWGAKYRRFAKL